MPGEALDRMRRQYFVREVADLRPRVYFRLTDNWLELTVRFIVQEHGVRDVKDAISRDLLDGFDAAGIGLASATFAVVEFPTLRIEQGTLGDARP